jgi:hypothetical protein
MRSEVERLECEAGPEGDASPRTRVNGHIAFGPVEAASLPTPTVERTTSNSRADQPHSL